MNSHVLYLALGTYRVRAAREHVKELASSGSQVVLVVADCEEWAETADELSRLDRVDVVRLGLDKHGSAWSAAKKLVADKSGPFATADVLIAGDAHALPTAWAALKRRPELRLQLEPANTDAHAAEPADLAVLTPWYPSPNNPYAGSFVQAMTAAVADQFDRITVFHTEDWGGRAYPALNDAIKVTQDRLRERRDLIPVVDSPEGTVVRVPAPLAHRKNYASWVGNQEKALMAALPTGKIEAPVVHAHTGIYGGVLALHLARPDARVVVTEHSSFLDKVFAQPAAHELYEAVLKRADAFLCVSGKLRDQIAKEFPAYADKLSVVPNMIDFERFTPGPERSAELLSWLYVGRLVKPKGVDELLEAFALVAREEPRATLTLVGHGVREEDLAARVEELGLGERVSLLPPVPPEDVNALMHRHDLLVHPSKGETFGMTVVEAVASGLPVLATRSGGPQESLAGIESRSGALMDISDNPRIIADAYWQLVKDAGGIDLPAAREVLESRYGTEAVAKQLLAVYEGVPLPAAETAGEAGEQPAADVSSVTESAQASAVKAPASTEPRGRAVILSLTPPGKPRRIVDFANFLIEQNVEVTLVSGRAAPFWERADLDRRVPVISIEAAEKKLRIPRGERLLVYRAPRAVLRRTRRIAARNRKSIGPELAVATVQRVHTRAANAFHRKIWNKGWGELRPQVLSRVARRVALPEVRLDLADHVFVADINSTVTGWKWAKANPHLTVTMHMDREIYAPKDE
ncbi:glycosyltransferase [Streptomyces sp. NPDC020681]|uniref:glycosyltransferase n=1 Tax=Streptomyces sp. NPDC020681 TaxID=3365083 RepID=UPI00379DC296